MNTPLYRLDKLKKNYGHKAVVDISSFEINKGEILGLMGANGSGKSTLLRHLAFLEEADSGYLEYDGHDASSLGLDKKREVSILLPEPFLLKRSVFENLCYGLKVRGEKEGLLQRANEALELVGLLPKKFLHRSWHELSSGETQRVALASRLILRPKTLLLDEPTNSLDFSGIPQFTNAILHAHKEWGTTVIIASHDLLWLSSIATRKVGLHFGRLMEFLTTNLIVGKWEEKEDGLFFHFDEKQKISLAKGTRIGEKRGVMIDPRSIFACKNPPKDESVVELEGILKESSYLAKTDEISLKISIAHHTFEAIESFQEFIKNPILPSQKVIFWFYKNSIVFP